MLWLLYLAVAAVAVVLRYDMIWYGYVCSKADEMASLV